MPTILPARLRRAPIAVGLLAGLSIAAPAGASAATFSGSESCMPTETRGVYDCTLSLTPAMPVAGSFVITLPANTYRSPTGWSFSGCSGWVSHVTSTSLRLNFGSTTVSSGCQFVLGERVTLYEDLDRLCQSVTALGSTESDIFCARLKPTAEEVLSTLVGGGALGDEDAHRLEAKLAAASRHADNTQAAIRLLEAFINDVEALVRSGRLGGADGDELIAAAKRRVAELEGSRV